VLTTILPAVYEATFVILKLVFAHWSKRPLVQIVWMTSLGWVLCLAENWDWMCSGQFITPHFMRNVNWNQRPLSYRWPPLNERLIWPAVRLSCRILS
jgi:hypothetical protein